MQPVSGYAQDWALRASGKRHQEPLEVSGHDFSRAAGLLWIVGFSPCVLPLLQISRPVWIFVSRDRQSRLYGIVFDILSMLLKAHSSLTRTPEYPRCQLLSPSFLVPCLIHDGMKVFVRDTLAIAEYLHEIKPEAGLLPADQGLRAHCRSISGEMHSGFSNLRSALPMNIKAHYPGFKSWAGARRRDIEGRVPGANASASDRGPYLFGAAPCAADAMYAPVLQPFSHLRRRPRSGVGVANCETVMAMLLMHEWIEAAKAEPVRTRGVGRRVLA